MKPTDLTSAKDNRIARLLAGGLLRATPEGQVYHLTRMGWTLACRQYQRGYLVGLINSTEAARGQERVLAHRVVAIAFHGVPEPGMQVNHRNGIKSDNRPENLEWVTALRNVEHAIETGLVGPANRPRGAANGAAKLSRSEVAEALRMFCSGSTRHELARAFKVSTGTIDNLLAGTTYVDAERPPSKEIRAASAANLSRSGERNPRAVLTEDLVREIRAKYSAGGQIAELAKKFTVSESAVRLAVKRKTWQNVD